MVILFALLTATMVTLWFRVGKINLINRNTVLERLQSAAVEILNQEEKNLANVSVRMCNSSTMPNNENRLNVDTGCLEKHQQQVKALKPSQTNLSDSQHKTNTEIVQFLLDSRFGSVVAMSVNTKQDNLVLARSDHFGNRMAMAGFIQLSWLDPRAEMLTDVPWVSHTVAWWKHTSNRSISPSTIVDMGKKSNYYKEFAKEYASGNLMKAAQLLSPYENGIDGWPSVAVIRNAIILREGQILNGSHIVHGKGCRGKVADHASLLIPTGIPRFHTVATIADFSGQHYFHFLAENLVRIPLVLSVLEQIPRSMLHVHSINRFVISLLATVGVPGNRVIEGTVLSDVTLLPEPTPCGTPPAVLLQLLRRTILLKNDNFGIHRLLDPSVECRILIIRRKATRRITNHDDLILGIKNYFTTCAIHVHTGDESTIQQMTLFRSSSLVIAPHGAGLTNIIACRKRTLVFEFLVPGYHVNICYMSMSFKLQLNYISMAVVGGSYGGTMTVNINDAMALLKSVSRSSETWIP